MTEDFLIAQVEYWRARAALEAGDINIPALLKCLQQKWAAEEALKALRKLNK